MPRKRKLDRYVSVFVDRYCKERFRFRRLGVSIYLPPPGSEEYAAAYAKALGGSGVSGRAVPGSVGDLVSRFYQTISFRRGGPGWQRTMRQTIEPFREEFADIPVRSFRPKDIDVILAKRHEKIIRFVNGRQRAFGGSSAAERLREMLMRLFKLAVKLEWIANNPVMLADAVGHKPKGYHPWTEVEIAKYRETWPLGTTPRLALELMLWTGARRSDAHRMPPPVNGRMVLKAAKTGKEINLPVAPALQAAIDAMPEVGAVLLRSEYGRPFTQNGLGQRMREWCDKAGLPHCTAHGIRKALTRRAADLNVSQQGLKSLGQWSQDREVATYAASANAKRMAEGALSEVVAWEQGANVV